jgi:hypothetical protein
MQAIWTSLVGVAGVLLGSWLTFVLQRQTAEGISSRERWEQRRQESLDAVGAYSSAVNQLRRAEHDRAKKRLTKASPEDREDARQETYRLRSDASSAYYRLWLRSDPSVDDDFLLKAENIIEMTKGITAYTETEAEMEELSSKAKNELNAFVKAARKKIDEAYSS